MFLLDNETCDAIECSDLDTLDPERLYQQAHGRAAQFRDLVEVGGRSLVTTELHAGVDTVLKLAMALMGATVGAVWLVDEHGQLRSGSGDSSAATPSLERVARQVLDGLTSIVEENQATEHAPERTLTFGVPLRPPDGTPVGALTVMMPAGSTDQADQSLDLLQLLASQLAATVAHAHVHEGVQENVDALITLNRIGEALFETLDPDEACEVLLDGALQLPGVAAAVISPVEGWAIETQREAGNSELLTQRSSHAAILKARASVLASGRMRQIRPGAQAPAGEVWLLPLRHGGRTLGTLEVHLSDGQAFGGLLALLESLAQQGASAIENARLFRSALAHEQALQNLVSRLITAQEEERRRVAYDIHDGLAQTTVATFQQLQLLAGHYRPRSAAARGYLQGALQAGQRAVTDARQIIGGLRPTILDDFGLAAAMRREVELLGSEGREVVFEDRIGPARFSPEVETTLYRVTQESLTNIRKHAGPAAVRVTIEQVEGVLRLEIRDWGRGFAGAGPEAAHRAEHIGLAGMRERVMLLLGTLSVAGVPGAGTTIVATVPVST